MRLNLPITDIETVLGSEQYLISKTDLKGRIVYANPEFIEVSGYSRAELIGKPQNIVRHPDMPPAAFQDLWDTIQAGQAWHGIVKNRRKDGGYYWVSALVAPIVEFGSITGYSSVRVKATEEQIRSADRAYSTLRDGKTASFVLQAGRLIPTGWRRLVPTLKRPFTNTISASIQRFIVYVMLGLGLSAFLPTFFTESNKWANWGIPAAIGVFLLLFALRLHKNLRVPLQSIASALQQISIGNLLLDTTALRNLPYQEQQSIGFNLDLMRKSLSAISNESQHNIQEVNKIIDRLNIENHQLSDRTSEQVASVEETAAAIEEITVSVERNAENAQMADTLATQSRQHAEKGSNEMDSLIATIKKIHESSQQVNAIINLIDDIAFQTNILALNAAVESARAGEAGRGFAVVAGEVRSLAQRSAEAAADIKRLIGDSSTLVSLGVQQAENTGQGIRDIYQAAEKVSHVVQEISSSTNEQAIGLQQINKAIALIDQTTHQNADFVHDLQSTATLLDEQCATLESSIRVLNSKQQHKSAEPTQQPLHQHEHDAAPRLASTRAIPV